MATPHQHTVHFYADEGYLFRRVGTTLEVALRRGHSALIVATDLHRDRFLNHLTEQGIAVAKLLSEGRIRMINAHHVLSKFLVDRWPDRDRFRDVVTPVISEMIQKFGKVAVYGEIVDILWRAGFRMAAVRLEELWNDLGRSHDFSLACGYQLDFCDPTIETGLLRRVCDNHSVAHCLEEPPKLEETFFRAAHYFLGSTQLDRLMSDVRRRRVRDSFSLVKEGLLWIRANMPEVAPRLLQELRSRGPDTEATIDDWTSTVGRRPRIGGHKGSLEEEGS